MLDHKGDNFKFLIQLVINFVASMYSTTEEQGARLAMKIGRSAKSRRCVKQTSYGRACWLIELVPKNPQRFCNYYVFVLLKFLLLTLPETLITELGRLSSYELIVLPIETSYFTWH